MSAPLYSALAEHRALGRSSFHTPGHKNSRQALPPDLYSLDFTELPDTDSLYDASGPILKAEKRAAALFGTARTCLSAGGCTLCVQAMLRLAAPRAAERFCARARSTGARSTQWLFWGWNLSGQCRTALPRP